LLKRIGKVYIWTQIRGQLIIPIVIASFFNTGIFVTSKIDPGAFVVVVEDLRWGGAWVPRSPRWPAPRGIAWHGLAACRLQKGMCSIYCSIIIIASVSCVNCTILTDSAAAESVTTKTIKMANCCKV
jgi:hypothetical protein